MNELALFAGAGGGILGGKLLGWRTVCAVEREPYAASVLAQRQNDGFLAPFPVWDDVCTFDGKPWRGIADVVSGGFPCQDISSAGNRAGIDGQRSGLWGEMARIIGEVRPRFAFVENSPDIVFRGLGRVLGDLAALGYDCRWTVLSAAEVGAPHRRERFWLVANADGQWQLQPRRTDSEERQRIGNCGTRVPDAACARCDEQERAGEALLGAGAGEFAGPHGGGWDNWLTEPDVGRVADGVAARVDRLKAIGNGQVPQCAAEAWRILTHNDQGQRRP